MDRRGRADPGPLAHGHPPLRRPVPLALLHGRPHHGDLRDLLRHPLSRTTSARRGARCASPPPTPGTPSTAPPSARSPAGSGSTGTSRTRPRATSRCARAAGPASTGRPRSAPSTAPPARAAGIFDESSFAKLEIVGPGRPGAGRAALRQRGRARSRPHHLHPDAEQPRRHRVRLHGHPVGRGQVLDRHRHRLRKPRPRVDPPAPARGRQRSGPRRHRAVGLLRRLGPEGPRDPAAAHAPGPRQRELSPT